MLTFILDFRSLRYNLNQGITFFLENLDISFSLSRFSDFANLQLLGKR